jgi:hypothetical protein
VKFRLTTTADVQTDGVAKITDFSLKSGPDFLVDVSLLDPGYDFGLGKTNDNMLYFNKGSGFYVNKGVGITVTEVKDTVPKTLNTFNLLLADPIVCSGDDCPPIPPLSEICFFIVPVDPTPLPATLPLFATGLGLFGLLRHRKKKKTEAAIDCLRAARA